MNRHSSPQYYKDASGEWRWRIIATNGDIVADSSEGYHNRGDAEAGYASAMTSDDE